MLFRCLNLSPPWAARAAAASSVGVLLAVMAGGAGSVSALATAGVFDLGGSALCVNAVAARKRSTTGVRTYRFILNFLPVKETWKRRPSVRLFVRRTESGNC